MICRHALALWLELAPAGSPTALPLAPFGGGFLNERISCSSTMAVFFGLRSYYCRIAQSALCLSCGPPLSHIPIDDILQHLLPPAHIRRRVAFFQHIRFQVLEFCL